jgi:hypothetical protein
MKNQPINFKLLFFLGITISIIFGLAENSQAATINATGCSQANVQTAINAASNGDIVAVPAGGCSWSSGISFSKAIKLQGAGAGGFVGRSTTSNSIGNGSKTFTTQSGLNFQTGETITAMYLANGATQMTGTVVSYNGTTLVLNISSVSGSGTYAAWIFSRPAQTIITNNYANTWNVALLDITENAALDIEVSGIYFVGGTIAGSNGGGEHIHIAPSTNGKPVLIHDNRFSAINSIGASIRTESNKGVVYKNSFDNGLCASSSLGCAFSVAQAISLKADQSTDAWTSPSYMGANDITGDHNFYIEDNYFAGFWQSDMDYDSNSRSVTRHNIFDNSALGSHGADSSSVGVRHYEIYDNTFIFTDMSDYTYNLNWWFFDRGGTGVVADNVMPNIISQAYGDKSEIMMIVMNLGRNSGPNPCWGFDMAGNQYPAPRQIGMGRVTGAGHDGLGRTTDIFTYVGDSEPLYIWNNTGNYAVAKEDYGWDPGTSCGTSAEDLAAKADSTNSYLIEGRDYFLNTSKPGYSKYTYPHPLTLTSSSDTTPPAAPSGLNMN